MVSNSVGQERDRTHGWSLINTVELKIIIITVITTRLIKTHSTMRREKIMKESGEKTKLDIVKHVNWDGQAQSPKNSISD